MTNGSCPSLRRPLKINMGSAQKTGTLVATLLSPRLVPDNPYILEGGQLREYLR